MEKVKKAVIPVAGYGTRYLPYTKAIPKAMLPVINRPAIEIIIEEACEAGIDEICLIVGQNRDILDKHFSNNKDLDKVLLDGGKDHFYKLIHEFDNIKITFIEQTEQKGTAHAVALAKDFVGGQPFAVMFGDDLMYNDGRCVIGQLIDEYEKSGKTIIGCKRVPMDQVSKYATVEYKGQNGNLFEIETIKEKPKPEEIKSNLSPLGRYVCDPYILDVIANLKVGKNGEYQLTDALDQICKERGGYALEFVGTRYDMGDRLGFLKANVEFGLRDERLKEKFRDYLKELVTENIR